MCWTYSVNFYCTLTHVDQIRSYQGPFQRKGPKTVDSPLLGVAPSFPFVPVYCDPVVWFGQVKTVERTEATSCQLLQYTGTLVSSRVTHHTVSQPLAAWYR